MDSWLIIFFLLLIFINIIYTYVINIASHKTKLDFFAWILNLKMNFLRSYLTIFNKISYILIFIPFYFDKRTNLEQIIEIVAEVLMERQTVEEHIHRKYSSYFL